MMLLQHTTPSVACAPAARRQTYAQPPAAARRLVRVRYQGPEDQRVAQQQQFGGSPTSTSSPDRTYNSPYYSSGYDQDPSESLREGWQQLKAKWDNWEPEERNRTLAWGGGGLLVLYLANGLINAIDRLPLLPQALQLVGLAYGTWFFTRYLLFAEGRQDLSRLSLDTLLGRSAEEATADFSRTAREAAEGVADGTERIWRGDPVGRALRDSRDGGGGGRLSSGSNTGYGTSELNSGIQGALHDIDRAADDLGGR